MPQAQKQYDVIGREIIEERLEGADARDAVLRFLTHNPGAVATQVGDRDIVALCESTGKPILDGDKFTRDDDGIYTLVEAVDTEAENRQVIDFSDEPEDATGGFRTAHPAK